MPAKSLHLPFLFVAAAVVLAISHSGEIRARAEVALGQGMPPREAELARGFVLGEDEGIDPETREDFRRSGLSHLLAVSGQNVALLALLAMPVLAALGMPLRARLLWILGLIAVYVPLAGAGPSIQRAGVMGALSVLATLAGRRASRFYALVAAAAVLLVLEPGIAADVGWQLSFAAVLGILLLAAPLRAAIAARIGDRGWRRALADGAAMTIAATLATAPLIAFHFEAISTATLLANLLALPAVAPAMWLGMLVAAAGQVPGFPVEALNSVNALLLAYVAQVAAWCGRPSWAYLHVRLGVGGLVASYLAIAATAVLALRLGRIRRLGRLRRRKAAGGPESGPCLRLPARRRGVALALALGMAVLGLAWGLSAPDGGAAPAPTTGLRVSVLDVGQGDAILLAAEERARPPGRRRAAGRRARRGAARRRRRAARRGDRHPRPVRPRRRDSRAARRDADRTAPLRGAGTVDAGGGPRRGSPRPPPGEGRRAALGQAAPRSPLAAAELLAGPHRGEDPNGLALVMLARWRRFSMLLTADAEAEATPLDPGPIDVLKVAHHGSDDAGLGALLDRARPRLAVISVGDDNPYGHPTPGTLATLAAHGVRTLRTDRDGTIALDVDRDSIRVSSGD